MNPMQAYSTGPSPQALGAAMMPLDVQQAQPPNSASPSTNGLMGLSPQMLQQLAMQKQMPTPAGVPSDAMSWNTGAGPLPWLPQNALPWSGGNG